MLQKTLFFAAIAITPLHAIAYEPNWEGNHPEAKSEAWTWMGHLREVLPNGALGRAGMGFIYYYTRNEAGGSLGGALNFRSSSRTTTFDGGGQSYRENTTYFSQERNGQLRAKSGSLLLEATAGALKDRVAEESMNAGDERELTKLLSLFPGLKVAPGYRPRKVRFQAMEKDGTKLDLTYYAIWPAVAPPGGRMNFLNQQGTFSYSMPMLVTAGTVGGKPMAGLSFLDRQWAKEYFGVQMMTSMGDLLQNAKAMNYAHSWSAFHARNLRTGEWSFFHLWRQFKRLPGKRDQQIDYSGMLFARGGIEYGTVHANDYSWVASGFVQPMANEILMDYALGRTGFFPSRATIASAKLGFSATLLASPNSQTLDQPIPFYEGYATGEGYFRGDKIAIQGRLESSRLLFREKDYEEMIESLGRETGAWRQEALAGWLKVNRTQDTLSTAFLKVRASLATALRLLNEVGLQRLYYGAVTSTTRPSADTADRSITIYR